MAKRRKTKRKTKKTSFKLSTSPKKKKRKRGSQVLSLINILKVLTVICVIAAAGIGFVFLERYVKESVSVSEKRGYIELAEVPVWVNEQLKAKIYDAATANGEDLRLDEDAAVSVQQNIETSVVWLDKIKVQTTHNSLLIKARWRKPLALVKSGSRKFYVDSKLVVLDFIPMDNLPIVKVKGLSQVKKTPMPGAVWHCDDLDAAVAILARLDRMDKLVTPDKPLLYEIDGIDVSNFNGRKNNHKPHIVLHTTDDTEIIWGAEIGAWQRYLEVPDEQKLARLYEHYKEFGSLLSSAKYINLCDPQGNIFRPTDKY